jgi:small subunit ribosomal protein S17
MARTLTGLVASAKGNKTITVAIQTRKTHPIYKKQYTVTTKFMAHDEDNTAKEGDRVVIAESRPLSARKRWTLVEVTEKAHVKHVEPTEEAA